jgi:caffeoyl-CoA O-methyltransferase
MDIIDPGVESYIASLDGSPDPVLAEMHALAEEREFPIVGAHAGRLLSVLVRATGARRVLELGSGFGYSAWWFARALPAEGRVVCTDFSTENRDLAMRFLAKAGLAGKVEYLVGDALTAARGLRGPFDIVFNDIDKQAYPESIDVAISLLRRGGLFITDNALWSGKVADEKAVDKTTRAVRAFNTAVSARPELESVILPVHDGLAVCVKK